ncbi:MAG: hypothetical protein H7Y88_11605 [Phycisphaerales bacterium]|nr:hypothetical protein [Phycisphaerales bacterium]
MRAFKKRIKLMKLDEESKLGVGPMSGGKKSQIVGIIPPNQYPRPVWEELAAKGSLRHTGGGFYEFVKDYEGH